MRRPSLPRWLAVVPALALGCAAGGATGVGRGAESRASDAPAGPATGKSAPVPTDVVERATAPFHGLRASDGTQLSTTELLDELSHADVICVGEDHGSPPHHYAELAVLIGLAGRRAMTGRELGLGLEMVERKFQPELGRFRVGALDESELLQRVEWRARWGFDFSYYRPQLEQAVAHGVDLVALNASRELTQAVARGGLDSVEGKLAKQLPALDLDDAEHRAWFAAETRDHPAPQSSPESLYAAQVVRDESMADGATRWLAGRLPGRQLVILAGSGHCRRDAVPQRIARRNGARVVSVRPMVLGAADDPCERLDAFDYALIFEEE